MKTMYLAVLVIASFILVCTPAHANLLVNPGFETGSFGTDWVGVNAQANSGWGPGAHSGTYQAVVWNNADNVGEAYQEVNVTADQAYAFNIWGVRDIAGLGDESTSAYYMALRWYADTTPLTQDNLDLGALTTSWAQQTINAVAPSTATKVQVVFGADGTANRASFYDDADFDTTGGPIPEPTSLLLLGSGLVGLVGLGRRTKR